MEQTLHLFVTDKCPYKCPLCCNKAYPTETIPVVTVEELKSSDIVCITGGDPFMPPFSRDVFQMIIWLRNQYKNIKKLYIYSSGVFFGGELEYESWKAIITPRLLGNSGIDGISFGPKSENDWNGIINFVKEYKNLKYKEFFKAYVDEECGNVVPTENRLYVFPEWESRFKQITNDYPNFVNNLHATVFHRKWQANFKPAENSIFRRLPILFGL